MCAATACIPYVVHGHVLLRTEAKRAAPVRGMWPLYANLDTTLSLRAGKHTYAKTRVPRTSL
jgi:hypothetical protein